MCFECHSTFDLNLGTTSVTTRIFFFSCKTWTRLTVVFNNRKTAWQKERNTCAFLKTSIIFLSQCYIIDCTQFFLTILSPLEWVNYSKYISSMKWLSCLQQINLPFDSKGEHICIFFFLLNLCRPESMWNMAIRDVEFSNGGYKIRNFFA